MTLMRIYVPLTAASLARLVEQRAIVDGPSVHAFGVTGRLERAHPGGDEEQWEYAALTEAVESADAYRGPAGRRLVAAADVDASSVSEVGRSLASVDVAGPIPLSRLVSFHIDESAGDTGMGDLLWYDITELDQVVDLF